MHDIIIVGGGPAGLTAATYARRAGKSVLLLEKEGFGGQIASSPKVENFPGFAAISGAELSDKLYAQADALGAQIELEEVLSIDAGMPHTVVTDYNSYTGTALILATGMKHRSLGLANEESLAGISYCAVCDGAFYTGRDTAVCGGGIGFCIREWLPAAGALAVLTIGLTLAVADWLCRIIPNPTVLAVFGLKLLLMAAALLHIPGAPTFRVLSSLIGMVFCLLVFSAPGLMGKRVGAGDIKLAAAMGFLLGLQTTLIAIVIMGVLMLGYSVFQRKMPLLVFLKTDIPMGPFLAAGMLLAWMLPYLPS